MKVLFLNDGDKFNNWGIQSTTSSLKSLLNQYVEKNIEFLYLPHELFVRKYKIDPSILGKKIFNRNSRLKKYLGDPICIPRYADEYARVYSYWSSGRLNNLEKDILNKILQSDMVVFNAEGSVYRNNKSAMMGLFLLALAGTLGKKTVFCNGSFSLTNQDNILESFAKHAIKKIDHIFIREPESFKVFCDHFSHPSVHMVPDAVFYDKKISRNVKPKQQFVISSSMLPLHSYRYSPHPIEQLVDQIKTKFNLSPVVAAIDTEDEYLRKIARNNNWKLLDRSSNIDEVRCEIGSSQFILSGRYHHLIYGVIEGTPIISFDTTSQKIRGLLNLVDDKGPLFDPMNIYDQQELLLDEVEQVIRNRFLISSSYKHVVTKINKLFKNYSLLK